MVHWQSGGGDGGWGGDGEVWGGEGGKVEWRGRREEGGQGRNVDDGRN